MSSIHSSRERPSRGEHAPFRAIFREALAEKGLLSLVARQRECPHLGCLGLLAAAKLQQECSPNGVIKMICFQIVCQGFDLAQGRLWSGHISQCYSPVQANDWRGGHGKQQIIERQN